MRDLDEADLAALTAVMKRAAEAIMAKGAESVVIIATANREGDLTTHSKIGRGNYYAQRGSVIEWIDSTREPGQSSVPPPPEEGDWWKE